MHIVRKKKKIFTSSGDETPRLPLVMLQYSFGLPYEKDFTKILKFSTAKKSGCMRQFTKYIQLN